MGEIIKNNLKITQRNAVLKEWECASYLVRFLLFFKSKFGAPSSGKLVTWCLKPFWNFINSISINNYDLGQKS